MFAGHCSCGCGSSSSADLCTSVWFSYNVGTKSKETLCLLQTCRLLLTNQTLELPLQSFLSGFKLELTVCSWNLRNTKSARCCMFYLKKELRVKITGTAEA